MPISTKNDISTKAHSLQPLMQRYVEYKNLHSLEGIVSTAIAEVRFFRRSTGYPRQPMTHESGIIIMGQGYKHLYAQGQVLKYGDGDSLIIGAPLPLDCEAINAPGAPLLGITINVSTVTLQKLATKLRQHPQRPPLDKSQEPMLLRSSKMTTDMLDATIRLLKAINDDLEAELFGDSLVEEIIYRALLSPAGLPLMSLADQEGRYARIARILESIHKNYAEPLNVDELASNANMSVSTFHTTFKKVTRESPIQYIKKLRLNKARELICFEGKRVNDAAHRVGYASTSQFSREFKRYFNESPKEAAQTTATI